MRATLRSCVCYGQSISFFRWLYLSSYYYCYWKSYLFESISIMFCLFVFHVSTRTHTQVCLKYRWIEMHRHKFYINNIFLLFGSSSFSVSLSLSLLLFIHWTTYYIQSQFSICLAAVAYLLLPPKKRKFIYRSHTYRYLYFVIYYFLIRNFHVRTVVQAIFENDLQHFVLLFARLLACFQSIFGEKRLYMHT